MKISLYTDRMIIKDIPEDLKQILAAEGMKESRRGYHYMEGKEGELYQILLKISQDYDVELI